MADAIFETISNLELHKSDTDEESGYFVFTSSFNEEALNIINKEFGEDLSPESLVQLMWEEGDLKKTIGNIIEKKFGWEPDWELLRDYPISMIRKIEKNYFDFLKKIKDLKENITLENVDVKKVNDLYKITIECNI